MGATGARGCPDERVLFDPDGSNWTFVDTETVQMPVDHLRGASR
jgi:hypothetical protein